MEYETCETCGTKREVTSKRVKVYGGLDRMTFCFCEECWIEALNDGIQVDE